jgi:putative membrane protein
MVSGRAASTHDGSLPRALLCGVAAGIVGNAAVAIVDRTLDPLISPAQRRRERRVRAAPPHRIAGPVAVEKVTGRRLDATGRRHARLGFTLAYGIAWGLAYAALRRRLPQTARFAGLPFGIPFFVACDGLIAPLLGLTPPPGRLPWQVNAKELANHVAWTAAAELVHRGVARVGA